MQGWNVSREVAVVPVDPSQVVPEFLALYIGSRSSQAWLTGVLKGVAYTGINIEDLRNLPIPAPSKSEQAKTADALNDALIQCRAIEDSYSRRLQNLSDLKQSILQRAFSGQLRSASPIAEAAE
jgi:type I restriction enzyme S subunit